MRRILESSIIDPADIQQLQSIEQQQDFFSEGGLHTKGMEVVVNPATTSSEHTLNEEEQLLLILKDQDNRSWKDIALYFQTHLSKTYRVPALQMRCSRLRKRLPVWTDEDIGALQHAHEYWETAKWDVISEKVRQSIIDAANNEPDWSHL